MHSKYGYDGIWYKNILNRSINVPFYFILLCLTSLSFWLSSSTYAQPETNLDIFYEMVDSSVNDLVSQLPQSTDSIDVELNLGESYSVFGNKFIAALYSSGKIVTDVGKNSINVSYIVDNAKVEYGEIFRDGFFGDYYISRNLSLNGNYVIYTGSAFYKEFNFSFNDSIRYNEIKVIENISFPFTQGEVPEEPFFSSIFVPIVAIGTAALAVILFFSIRSK